jgi:thiol-disulfide isomerase/thioredoxin
MTPPVLHPWARIAGGCLLLGVMSGISWGQPFHDNFENRMKLSSPKIEVTSTNLGASEEPGELAFTTAEGGASVWWEWTAPASGQMTASTAGSSFDTFLGVFDGETIDALIRVASNDDEDLLGGIFTSRLNFFARKGTRYQITVAGVGNGPGLFATGDIRLQIAPAALKPMPSWDLVTLDSKPINSSALPGKIVIVDFWATWCAPCRAEIPSFIDLQNRYGKDGLVILGVSVDTVGVASVQAFADELKINYPLVMSTPALEQALGGVPSIPTAFILDSNNSLIARHIGFRDHDFWESEVKALLDTEAEPLSLQGTRSGDRIEISWTSEASNWTLQAASDPGGPWSLVPDPPEIKDGHAVVSISLTPPSAGFFRLVQP